MELCGHGFPGQPVLTTLETLELWVNTVLPISHQLDDSWHTLKVEIT